MRKIVLIILSVLVVVSVSSCDFVRRVAGRPTSEELNQARELKVKIVAREKAKADSLEAVRLAEVRRADSLKAVAAADSALIANTKAIFRKASRIGKMDPLEYPYYISLGIFRNKENSAMKIGQAQRAGYEVTIGRCGPCEVILICPCKTKAEAVTAYEEVSRKRFCPQDAFILIAE